jgi:hypothetical protein
MSNLNRGNNNEEVEKPEKDRVKIYDNDEAYMLHDDKYLDLDSANRDGEAIENLEEGNNFEGQYEEGENLVEEGLIDDETAPKEEDYDLNSNQQRGNSQLITLKYISVCQCCKENFNSNLNIPYLLKCGHFFCKTCLENNFTEEDGQIFCPDDGIVANSLRDLKLLNNLILDKGVDQDVSSSQRSSGYCQEHPDQKLSHYVEETREVICVYCAFNKFKKNPKYEIKELKDKCQEILVDVDKILNDNQHYVETLQTTLKEIKENKVTEEERVSNLYDEIIKYLEEKKNEMFENISNMFATNADKLSEKLDYFSNKMEDAEELKANIVAVMNINSSSNSVNEVLQRYSQFMREANDSSKLNLELIEYKFSHDDENKMYKYLNNFGDLKSKTKHIRFMPKGSDNYSVAYNPQEKEEFKVKNQDTKKKNFDNNFTANNKYSNLFQNDALNTSELLNENNDFSVRANTQNNYMGNNLNTSDYLAKPYTNLLRPTSSSKFK